MTKKTLLTISAIADAVDLAAGWMPGPWSFIVDVPVTICHFLYAGPRAFWVLAEYIPVVGVVPIYTIAAMTYPDKDKASKPSLTVIDVEAMPIRKSETVVEPPIIANATPPRLPPAAIVIPIEERLQKLDDLLGKKMISQTEYETKRQEILAEI